MALLSPSSLISSSPSSFFPKKHKLIPQHLLVTLCCKAISSSPPSVSVNKRSFVFGISSAFLQPLARNAEAVVLEAEDDLELLQKVKQDRKKRLEKQGIINSSKKETGYLQELVYKLSEVGQAIDNNDISTARSVLGGSTDTDWIKKANSAFSKLSSSPEEKAEVEEFNTSISKLISSVTNKDAESSKIAFISSATAFEKWTTLTGLDDQLKGL